MQRRQILFRAVLIALVILDIAIGWYRFYQLFVEVEDIQEGRADKTCSDVAAYWILYAIFQIVGTITDSFAIVMILHEVYMNILICEDCFRQGFVLVMVSYIVSIFPISILSILFQAKCVCVGTLSFSVVIVEVTVFFKTFVGGLSMALFQVLLHLTEFFTKLRRLFSFVGLCGEIEQTDDDATLPFFIINLVLAAIYIVLFIIELAYLFCHDG